MQALSKREYRQPLERGHWGMRIKREKGGDKSAPRLAGFRKPGKGIQIGKDKGIVDDN